MFWYQLFFFIFKLLFIYLILLKFILIDFEVKQIMFWCYCGFGTPVPQTKMGGGQPNQNITETYIVHVFCI